MKLVTHFLEIPRDAAFAVIWETQWVQPEEGSHNFMVVWNGVFVIIDQQVIGVVRNEVQNVERIQVCKKR